MKEFQSTTGGRHAYNTDFKNLQELALAMQEIFRECGGNFIISGCNVTAGDKISVSDGYAYINGKICKVSGASGLSPSNLYIVAMQRNGDSIPYANGGDGTQYIDYYAEAVNNASVNAPHIAYNTTDKSFPNLSTAFFNYYAVCKRAGEQSVDSLSVQQRLTVQKQLLAIQGVQFDGSSSTQISADGSEITVHNGDCDLCFSNTGIVSVKRGGSVLFMFSDASGSGLVTFGSVTVQSDLKAKKLYIDGVDIEQKLTPLGVVQMWAGPIDKIPQNYKLCNGQAVSRSDYPELYSVIGTTFNNSINKDGIKMPAPASGQFRLPDLRQRFIAGYDPFDNTYHNIANVGGEKRHMMQISEMPPHDHGFDDYYYIEHNASVTGNVYGKAVRLPGEYRGSLGSDDDNDTVLSYHHHTDWEGGTTPHENRPPFYVLAYIMCVK